MSDDLDPQLMRHFAATQVSFDDAPFIADAERRLQRSRRVRRIQRWAVAIVLLALAALLGPHVITASVAMNESLAEFLLTPWGLGASMVAGALIVWRARGTVNLR